MRFRQKARTERSGPSSRETSAGFRVQPTSIFRQQFLPMLRTWQNLETRGLEGPCDRDGDVMRLRLAGRRVDDLEGDRVRADKTRSRSVEDDARRPLRDRAVGDALGPELALAHDDDAMLRASPGRGRSEAGRASSLSGRARRRRAAPPCPRRPSPCPASPPRLPRRARRQGPPRRQERSGESGPS